MPSSLLITQVSELLLNYYRDHFPGKYCITNDDIYTYYIYGHFSFSDTPVSLCYIYIFGAGMSSTTPISIYLSRAKFTNQRVPVSFRDNTLYPDTVWDNINQCWEAVIRSHLDSDLQYHMFLHGTKRH